MTLNLSATSGIKNSIIANLFDPGIKFLKLAPELSII